MNKTEKLVAAKKIAEIRDLLLDRARFRALHLQQKHTETQQRADHAESRMREQASMANSYSQTNFSPDLLMNCAAAVAISRTHWLHSIAANNKASQAVDDYRKTLATRQQQRSSAMQLVDLTRKKLTRERDEKQATRLEELFLAHGIYK